jgi:predicted cobalt transporter CbtA
MLFDIIDDFRDAVSGTLGDVFTVFVNGLFIAGILLFLVAAQNLFGHKKNVVWGIFYGFIGFGLLLFSFQMGNPFGISLINHGYTGISY